MKKALYKVVIFTALANNAFAQTSLQPQLEAVNEIHEYNTEYKKEKAAKSADYLAKKRLKREKAAKLKQDVIDEKIYREQSFEEELRLIQVEERRLELKAKKAKFERVNDYIDQELNSQAAQTDVIQSKADAMRNVSIGTKEYLQKTGNANEVSASKD